jgi:nitroreductase
MENIEIIPQVKQRWSPRTFKNIELTEQQIISLIDAARWAPSSRNNQPWRFILAGKNGKHWEKLLDCINEGNKIWAKEASLLILGCTVKIDPLSGNTRKHAWYDLGQAVSNLTYQANSMGIFIRNMGGFSTEKAIANFSIPPSVEPVIVLAAGYPDDTVTQNPYFEVPVKENRKRIEVSQLIYTDSWDDLLF